MSSQQYLRLFVPTLIIDLAAAPGARPGKAGPDNPPSFFFKSPVGVPSDMNAKRTRPGEAGRGTFETRCGYC